MRMARPRSDRDGVLTRWRAMVTAMRMAAFMLAAPAMFLPAMSKAVPWSTEVRIMGMPSEMLTVASKSRSFMGM